MAVLSPTVDPAKLDKLDRRSTMLMAASRSHIEDEEKRSVSAFEERESCSRHIDSK